MINTKKNKKIAKTQEKTVVNKENTSKHRITLVNGGKNRLTQVNIGKHEKTWVKIGKQVQANCGKHKLW